MSLPAHTARLDPNTRRDLILGETLSIVAERGFNGFGIQELALRCGLTKPGLLHHFGSKDQLLIALMRDVDAKEEAALAAVHAPAQQRADTPRAHRENYHQALRAAVERSLKQPELIRLRVMLRAESLNPAHPAHAYFNAREAETLTRLAKGAEPFSAHPESTARQVLALTEGLQGQWIRSGQGFDLLAEWDRAAAFLA